MLASAFSGAPARASSGAAGRRWTAGAIGAVISVAFWTWVTRSAWVAGLTLFWCAWFTAGLRLAGESLRARIGLAMVLGGFSAAVAHYLMRH
jgi:hypothetical protein